MDQFSTAERSQRMFRKLISTSDDYAVTIARLVLGVVFFAHGAQKMLGWFGGYGFTGTMNFFTQMMHIPAPFAFLAICAEFFGGLGCWLGVSAAWRHAVSRSACWARSSRSTFTTGSSPIGRASKRARVLSTT